MVINSTRAVDDNIQEILPLSATGSAANTEAENSESKIAAKEIENRLNIVNNLCVNVCVNK